MEQLLHYLWKHKIFPLQPLFTTNGASVEVIDAGLPNKNAGPDFFNAKLKIDGVLWVGNVEIHEVSTDWEKHGHHLDKMYDSVILHVVGSADCEVKRTTGEKIPQLELPCPDYVMAHYRELLRADVHPSCYHILSKLPRITVRAWLTALQTERLEEKTTLIQERLAFCDNYWEDAFFITLARNLGFGLNGDAFELWAKKIPLRKVDKIRDDLMRVEAFFFGMAGLLEKVDVEDAYLGKLKQEFLYLRKVYELPQPLEAMQWRLLRTRPGNFPHVRIAQLAYMYQQERGIFSRMLEAQTIADARKLFKTQTSAYWETHFVFGRTSSQRKKTLGEGACNLLIINTMVPFLYAYGSYRGEEKYCQRAFDFLEQLKAEDNYITRMWKAVGISVESAAESQALIQLHKSYCEKKRCLFCRFGYEFLKRDKNQ